MVLDGLRLRIYLAEWPSHKYQERIALGAQGMSGTGRLTFRQVAFSFLCFVLLVCVTWTSLCLFPLTLPREENARRSACRFLSISCRRYAYSSACVPSHAGGSFGGPGHITPSSFCVPHLEAKQQ